MSLYNKTLEKNNIKAEEWSMTLQNQIMMKQTIKILGAGPSGLSAAINLAKAGYKVSVFERRPDCGWRFGGDLQGLENWSYKENVITSLDRMNISVNFDCKPFSTLMLTNGKQTLDFNLTKPLTYIIKRGTMEGSLDQGLKKQAFDAGVRIYFNKTIPQEQAQIVATGPNVHKIVWGTDVGIVFKTTMSDTAVALVKTQAAYKGYAYLLVTNGYGCMCTVAMNNRANECFKETKEIFSRMFKLDIREPKKVGGVGSFAVKNVFQKNGVVYVGEAACIQDALWGFGIRSALVSGYLAAQSIIRNTDYEAIAKTHFTKRLKASVVNRFLWEVLNGESYTFLLKLFKQIKNPQFFLYRIYNYTFIQKLLYPLALIYFTRIVDKKRRFL